MGPSHGSDTLKGFFTVALEKGLDGHELGDQAFYSAAASWFKQTREGMDKWGVSLLAGASDCAKALGLAVTSHLDRNFRPGGGQSTSASGGSLGKTGGGARAGTAGGGGHSKPTEIPDVCNNVGFDDAVESLPLAGDRKDGASRETDEALEDHQALEVRSALELLSPIVSPSVRGGVVEMPTHPQPKAPFEAWQLPPLLLPPLLLPPIRRLVPLFEQTGALHSTLPQGLASRRPAELDHVKRVEHDDLIHDDLIPLASRRPPELDHVKRGGVEHDDLIHDDLIPLLIPAVLQGIAAGFAAALLVSLAMRCTRLMRRLCLSCNGRGRPSFQSESGFASSRHRRETL